MVIRFNNYARMLEKRGIQAVDERWYRSLVFVDEDDGTLDKIDSITYVLHSTFPDPVRVVNDRSSKFALEMTGWGSFSMKIRIRYKNGTEEYTRYFLDLSKEWPTT